MFFSFANQNRSIMCLILMTPERFTISMVRDIIIIAISYICTIRFNSILLIFPSHPTSLCISIPVYLTEYPLCSLYFAISLHKRLQDYFFMNQSTHYRSLCHLISSDSQISIRRLFLTFFIILLSFCGLYDSECCFW